MKFITVHPFTVFFPSSIVRSWTKTSYWWDCTFQYNHRKTSQQQQGSSVEGGEPSRQRSKDPQVSANQRRSTRSTEHIRIRTRKSATETCSCHVLQRLQCPVRKSATKTGASSRVFNIFSQNLLFANSPNRYREAKKSLSPIVSYFYSKKWEIVAPQE